MSTIARPEQPAEAGHPRRWWVLVTLCSSTAVIVMDNTILNVAIPSLIRELDASNSEIQWIIDSYTLVFAGLLLTTGSLSDRFGRKGALQAGVAIFTVCSVWSALATSASQLIAARAFMGIGGALIMPSTLSIVMDVFRDPKERGRAIALWAGVSGLGVALGPIVGGVLLEHFSWGSVFWVNLPVGIVGLVAAAVVIPTSRDPNQGKLDPLGSALSIGAFGALLFGIIEGPVKGWSDGWVIGGFVVGLGLFVVFIAWERRAPSPMLNLAVFRNPRFSAASGAITLVFFSMFGALLLMTQYWQFIQGYTALETGVRLLPYAAAMMVAAATSARFVEVFGTKRVMMAGLIAVATALALLSVVDRTSPYPAVIAMYCLLAFGAGMCSAPATESVMGSLPRSKAGVGSAMNDTARQMGAALGVAIVGSVVTSVFAHRIDALGDALSVSETDTSAAERSLGAALEVSARLGSRADSFARGSEEGFVSAMGIGMRIAVVVVLGAAIVVWRYLPARAVEPRAASADESVVAESGSPV